MDVTDVEEVVDIVSTTGQVGIHTGLRSVLLEIHAVEVIVAVGVLPHGCLCLIVRICRIETEERVLVFVNDFLRVLCILSIIEEGLVTEFAILP